MTDPARSHDASELLRPLAQLDRRARLAALMNGLGLTAFIVTAVIAVAVLTDLLWDVPLAVRVGFLSAAAVAAAGGSLWAAARSLLRRSDPAAVAAMVEATFPQLHERLSSIMEWDRQDAGSGSPLMRELVFREAQRDLRQLDVAAPLPLGRATRRGAIGTGVLAGLLLPCLFFGGYRLLLVRFATPWRNLERAANLYFVVEPGDATVSRGADVEFTAAPRWRVAQTQVDSATLHWRDESGQQFERQMTWNAERAAFTATISHVLQPFAFEIRSGRTQTREFQIDVVDRPSLMAVIATIEPPAYSGRAVEEVAGAVGDLELLRGSRLLVQMQFSLPVDQAALLWLADAAGDGPAPEPVKFPAQVSGDRLSAEVAITPEASGRFILQLHDAIGPVNQSEPQRRVIIVGDEPPQIRFADRNPTSRAGPRDVLRLPVSAEDDIGLAAVELHYEVVGDKQQTGMLPAPRPVLGLRTVQEVFEFDLSKLKLNEGSIVSLRSRAADECPPPGPQAAWTQQQLITISEQADPYESEQLAQRQQQLSQALQRLRAAVADNRQSTETLRAHAAQRTEVGAPFDRDADLASLTVADDETSVEAERLAAMFDLHPLLETLGDRLRRVSREPLTAAGQKSTDARTADNTEKPGLLASAHEQLVQAEDELAAVQRDLEHLADLEHDLLELQRLADDAERLAQDVAGLQQSTKKAGEAAAGEPDPLAAVRAMAADRLREDHADLSRRLDDLLDRRPELLDSTTEFYLEQLAALREQAQLLANRERGLAGAIEQEPAPAEAAADSNQPATEGDNAADTPLDELAARQSQLVDRAVQIALSAAETESPAASAIADATRESARAAESIESGDLTAAAEAAQQSAQRAAQAAAEGAASLDPEETGEDLLQQFAADQQALAQELAAAAAAPDARSAAQRQSQQRLAERTQQLERQFADVAGQLTTDPLARSDDGARAADSSEATRAAQQFMESASAAQAGGDPTTAVSAAQQAAAQLELAAEQVRSAVENSPDSPVPTDVGQQVAQASRQLRTAGEQLGDAGPQVESSDSDQAADAQAADAADSQPQQADAESQMSENAADDAAAEGAAGEPAAGSEDSELAKAAAALQSAARRLKPRSPGDQQAPGEASAGQQPGTEPNPDAASEGAGTAETVRLTDLAARMQARAMRNWGQLPGELQSELQQRSYGRPDADYAPLIRMYFNEISRRQSPSREEAP